MESAALADLRLHSSGKVREMYEVDGDLLMVASDRISAYDVIMPNPIPDKGRVLTQMSVFWFKSTAGPVPNHLLSRGGARGGRGQGHPRQAARHVPGRMRGAGILVRLGVARVPESGSVCGIELPAGLRESERLPEPIFTPATKAEVGDHDENIDFDRAAEIIGDRPLMEELRRVSIELYAHAAAHAEARGIILADTKFEFGASPGRRGGARRRGRSLRTPRASGRRTSTSPGARSAPSTSSTSATGWTRSAGTTARRRRSSRRTWSPTRGPGTSRPTSGSRAGLDYRVRGGAPRYSDLVAQLGEQLPRRRPRMPGGPRLDISVRQRPTRLELGGLETSSCWRLRSSAVIVPPPIG